MSKEIAKQQASGPLAAAKQMDDVFGNDGPVIPVDAPIPTIKIMRESAQFELPDGTYAAEIEANILHYHNANAYWEVDFEDRSPEDNPAPNCLSSDGITPEQMDVDGYKVQSDTCRNCPMNEYGSAKNGSSKACQNTIRMYVLINGEVVPCLLKAPPSSLGKKESLMGFLTNLPNITTKNGCAYQQLRIRFSLYKKELGSGMSASLIKMELADIVTDEAAVGQLAQTTKRFREAYLGKVADHMANEAVVAEEGDDIPI